MNVPLRYHIRYLLQEMYVQIELNVDHLRLPMSNYHPKEHLAMFLKSNNEDLIDLFILGVAHLLCFSKVNIF